MPDEGKALLRAFLRICLARLVAGGICQKAHPEKEVRESTVPHSAGPSMGTKLFQVHHSTKDNKEDIIQSQMLCILLPVSKHSLVASTDTMVPPSALHATAVTFQSLPSKPKAFLSFLPPSWSCLPADKNGFTRPTLGRVGLLVEHTHTEFWC